MIDALFPAINASRPGSGTARRGVVYGIACRDPWTGTGQVFLGYVGQTRQAPGHAGWPLSGALARLAGHEDKPWFDLLVEVFVIDAGQAWTDDELDARERYYIAQLRPAFNIDHNRDNPHRIPPWTAVEQRAARDAMLGRDPFATAPGAGRAVPRQFGRKPEPWDVAGTVVHHRVPRLLAPWRWPRLTGLAVLWLVLAAGLWAASWGRVPAGEGVWLAVAGAGVVFLVAWLSGRRKRRRR